MKSPIKPDPALLAALADLADILEQENLALSKSEFRVSGDIAPRKREAIGAVEALLGSIQAETSRDRTRLAPLHQRLDRAIGQNRTLLQRAIDTQQRVISTIVEAIEPSPAHANYPARTGNSGYGRPTSPMALAVRA
jgi:hypothetical protein